MKRIYLDKRKLLIIIACIILILFPFRYIIITDVEFLIKYSHFKNAIEIIRNDYVMSEQKILYIDISKNEIRINQVYGVLSVENPNLANEIKAIYGNWTDVSMEIYIDDAGKMAVQFDLNVQRPLGEEEYTRYSVVYVEDGFAFNHEWVVNSNGWFQVREFKNRNSDYLNKDNWFRWREGVSIG